MDNVGTTYFTEQSIDISDMQQTLCKAISKMFFEEDIAVEEISIVLPANTTYNYSYFEFPGNKKILSFYNLCLSKIDTVDADILPTTVTGTTTSTLTDNLVSVYGAKHGAGYYFQNETTSRTIRLRYAYVSKTTTTVNQTFLDRYIIWYYLLYVDQFNNFIFSTRDISQLKRGAVSENKNIAKKTRVHYGVLKAPSL